MSYLAIKYLHITSVVLSGSFFLLRGLWMLLESDLLQRRWVKVLPHIIDTLLLGSALVMVFWSRQYPFVQAWLTAKVLALTVYIVLGSVALKRGKTRGVRRWAFAAALATFAYIVAVALTRQAMIPFAFSGVGN
ncbi:MAG: SirB2 family protein [Polaromonas sp.]